MSNHPSTADISLYTGGQLTTTLKTVQFVDRTLVFITNLGRVGHVIEISFTALYQMLGDQLPGAMRSELYETKTLLGPDFDGYDLLVARFAKILFKYGQFKRPVWLMLGLDLDSVKDIAYLRQIVNRLDEHFFSLVK